MGKRNHDTDAAVAEVFDGPVGHVTGITEPPPPADPTETMHRPPARPYTRVEAVGKIKAVLKRVPDEQVQKVLNVVNDLYGA